MFYVANTWLSAELGAVKTAFLTGTTTHPEVHLIAAAFTPSATADPTTFVEATFDGYAAESITSWSPTHLDQNGQQIMLPTTLMSFTPTGSTTSNQIFGYWIVDATGAFVGCEAFTQPVLLDGPGTVLQFVPAIAMAQFSYSAPILP